MQAGNCWAAGRVVGQEGRHSGMGFQIGPRTWEAISWAWVTDWATDQQADGRSGLCFFQKYQLFSSFSFLAL